MRLIRWLAAGFGVAAAALAGAWLLGLVGPLGPIGGGRLRGEPSPLPADWSFADRVAEVKVETQLGPLPWSVTTWALTHDRRFYIPSRNCLAKRWVKNILADPEVRVQVDGRLYEMRAVREEDPVVGRALLEQMLVKYLGIEAEDPQPAQGGDPATRGRAYGCVFRLEPRS